MSAHQGIEATAIVDTRVEGRDALYANDGMATEDSAWLSEAGDEGHWLRLDFEEPRKIAEAHLFSGLRAVKGSLIASGELQVLEGEEWRKVAEFAGNRNEELKIPLDPPLEVRSSSC